MATYTYRCAIDGAVDVRLPDRAPPPSVLAARPAAPPRRAGVTAPMLGLADRGAMAALDRTEASR